MKTLAIKDRWDLLLFEYIDMGVLQATLCQVQIALSLMNPFSESSNSSPRRD